MPNGVSREVGESVGAGVGTLLDEAPAEDEGGIVEEAEAEDVVEAEGLGLLGAGVPEAEELGVSGTPEAEELGVSGAPEVEAEALGL